MTTTMATHSKHSLRSELSWSLLDPKPILLYVEHVDDYLVYWNGIVMPHSMALCMSMEFLGVWPSPEMKMAMETTYRRIYFANGFGTRSWDQKVEASEIYPYLKRIMKDHLEKHLRDRDPKDILNWFNYNRARKEETNANSVH